jgi:lipopolysaccharide transport system permease protein
MGPFKLIKRHFALLKSSVIVDIKQQHAGSILGLFWIFLGPLFLLTIYAFIYALVLKVRPSDLDTLPYILFIFSGLVPFLSFSGGLTQGTGTLAANKQLLMNTVFPSELLILKSGIVNALVLVIGLAITILASFVILTPSVTVLLVPFIMVMQVLFVVGITWIFSLINLVAKDIQQLLTYLVTLLMIISPIAYTPAMIPSSMKFVIYLNPLSYYILCYQQCIVYGVFPNLMIFSVMILQSLLMFCIGYSIFNRAKRFYNDFA